MGMAPPPEKRTAVEWADQRASDQVNSNGGKVNNRAVVNNTRATPEAAAATDAANSPAKALQSPTLTDILMRDIASGQVRTLRKGGRRGTFSGGAMSPYGDLPPLGS